MKNLLLLVCFVVVSFTCFAVKGGGGVSDDIFKAAAKGLCDCVKSSSTGLSERMKKIIADAKGDPAELEKLLGLYIADNIEAAMADVEVLTNSMEPKMSVCFEEIDLDTDSLEEDIPEEEFLTKILEALETMKGCELTLSFYKIGVAAEDESPSLPADE